MFVLFFFVVLVFVLLVFYSVVVVVVEMFGNVGLLFVNLLDYGFNDDVFFGCDGVVVESRF